MPRQKINPAKATPQAPRALRVGSKTKTRAEAPPAAPAPKADADAEDGDPDDEDEDEDEKDQEAHDAACASAAEACRSAADAYEAATGTDSASALQAAEEASAAARDACVAGESSCAKMRGAEPAETDDAPPSSRPGLPMPNARAIAGAAPVATAAAHLEVAALAKLGRDVLARTGATSADAAMLKVEAAFGALAEVKELRAAQRSVDAAANLAARIERLKSAVHAGMDRSKAFTIKADGTIGAPKAVWLKGTAKDLDETLATMGYPAGAPATARANFIAPTDDGEVGLAARAKASGMTIEERRASEANVARGRKP